jgi:hypothetical protein
MIKIAKMHKYTIVIEDISDGKEEAFMARISCNKCKQALAMADTIPELFESIQQTLEVINE